MMEKLKKRDYLLLIYIGIVTALMFAFSISCSALEKKGDIIWTPARVVILLGISLGIGALVAVIIGLVVSRSKRNGKNFQLEAEAVCLRLPKWTWVSCPVILGAWLPAYLAFYPSLCSYDSEGFFFQFVYEAFNNHHPIAYTLIVEFFYKLGDVLFGSYTVGIGIFTIVQMLLLALSMTIFIRTIYRAYGRKWLYITLTALFALHPMNAYMSVTMTKDIYFAMGMLLAFSSLILKLFFEEVPEMKWKNSFMLVAGLILIVVFRSNGRYCVLATLVVELVCLWVYRANIKKVFLIVVETLAGFLIGMLIVIALDKITNAQEVDKREMFSLPAQQIARVVHLHEEELSEETMQQIQTVIWPSSLYLYNRRTARYVKQDVISYEILHYPGKYAKLYWDLLKEYPGDYVNAFLGIYGGFLNPWDVSHVRINEDTEGMLPDNFHYIQTAFTVTDRFMVDSTPLSKPLHDLYNWYANHDIYLRIPGLSLLFVPGIYLWVMLYCFGVLVYQKKGICCIPCSLVFAYFLTFLLGPTVQLRYIFPIMVCAPGIILLTLIRVWRKKDEINHSDTLL